MSSNAKQFSELAKTEREIEAQINSNAKKFSELAKAERELEAYYNETVTPVAPVAIEPHKDDPSPWYVPTSPSYSPTSPEYRVRSKNS